MKRTFALLLGVFILAGSALAQDYPKGEFSATYSYLRTGFTDGVNQQGASISIAGNLNRWFGIAGDFGGYHTPGLDTFTFLAGPRITARNSSGVNPFAQFLAGGAHLAGSSGITPFAYSAGGGIDLPMGDTVGLRPQVDYIAMRANGSTLNTLRVSVGMVFRFGGKY